MNTKIVFLTIGVLVLGIMGSAIGTGMLLQQADAASCQFFFEGNAPATNKINCSSDNSRDNPNANNHINSHVRNIK